MKPVHAALERTGERDRDDRRRSEQGRHAVAGARTAAAMTALFLAACNGPGVGTEDDQREAALARARANPRLVEAAEKLHKAGWEVSAVKDAEVERLSSSPGGTPASAGSTADTDWTRVTLTASRGGGEGGRRLEAQLSLAWAARAGEDVFVLRPRNEETAAALIAALPDGTDDAADKQKQALTSEVESRAESLSCEGFRASCTGGRVCCGGFSCYGPDNHETCHCSSRWSREFPDGATASTACFSLPGNPFGLAYWRRRVEGCGNGLRSDQCGRTIGVPAYTERTNRWLVCSPRGPCGG
jgi:hypothetical protein